MNESTVCDYCQCELPFRRYMMDGSKQHRFCSVAHLNAFKARITAKRQCTSLKLVVSR